MTDIVVGCPTAKRSWCLPTWREHVEAACEVAGLTPEYVFVMPDWDNEAKDLVRMWRLKYKVDIIEFVEPMLPDHRKWGEIRVKHLVELRNSLLGRVRQISPEYFWSIDSDVLAHRDSLATALDVFQARGADAVGMHLYMSPLGRHHGSRGNLDSSGHQMDQRISDTEMKSTFPTDIVMGSFVARPSAYKVDYQYSPEGEDVGWAIACKKADLRFWWSAQALCKHVMATPGDTTPGYDGNASQRLTQVDARVGF